MIYIYLKIKQTVNEIHFMSGGLCPQIEESVGEVISLQD